MREYSYLPPSVPTQFSVKQAIMGGKVDLHASIEIFFPIITKKALSSSKYQGVAKVQLDSSTVLFSEMCLKSKFPTCASYGDVYSLPA